MKISVVVLFVFHPLLMCVTVSDYTIVIDYWKAAAMEELKTTTQLHDWIQDNWTPIIGGWFIQASQKIDIIKWYLTITLPAQFEISTDLNHDLPFH